jgi:hypothetical protein
MDIERAARDKKKQTEKLTTDKLRELRNDFDKD